MAIQVNGTTVIDNSRALNNITSVDSTTKSAIETAGVGGSTTNLGDTSLSGTPTSFDVTLDSGYDKHLIHVSGITSNDYSGGIRLQMANSSGSILGSGHSWSYFDAPNYADAGSNNIDMVVQYNGVYNTTYPGVLTIEIINARNSGKRTIGFARYHEISGTKVSITGWRMDTVQENTKLRIKVGNSSYRLAFDSGAYYTKYGVK